MFLRLDGKGALNRQLYRALRVAIEKGVLKPGDRVMPTRTLCERLGLSRNVILMAYAQLQAEGYVTSRQGSGTFVVGRDASARWKSPRRRMPDTLAQPSSAIAQRLLALPDFNIESGSLPKGYFDFRYGQTHVPEETRTDWLRTERRTLRTAFAAADLSGLPELRRAIAAYLRQHRGLTVAADDIIVTSGVRETLDLTLRLCVDPGATMVIEDPHYLPLSLLARTLGAKPHFVPVDASGLDTHRLPHSAALAYVTPSHQYPTGAVLAIERRRALLDWAGECGAFIVEDDYDSEFRYDAQPLPPLKTLDTHDRVIYAGSLSKVLSSAVRVGFIIAPSSLAPAYRKLKSLTTGSVGSRVQSVLAAFINDGLFARHLRRLRRIYCERRATLLDALDRHLGDIIEIEGAAAGLHVLVKVKSWSASDAARFMKAAAERRIGIFPATALYAEPAPTLSLLLAFGGIEAQRMDAGVRALAEVIGRRGRG